MGTPKDIGVVAQDDSLGRLATLQVVHNKHIAILYFSLDDGGRCYLRNKKGKAFCTFSYEMEVVFWMYNSNRLVWPVRDNCNI